MYQADSIKVALGIGNGALGIHCVMITLANHFIVLYAQITSRGEKKRNNYQPILHDKVNYLALLFCRELQENLLKCKVYVQRNCFASSYCFSLHLCCCGMINCLASH